MTGMTKKTRDEKGLLEMTGMTGMTNMTRDDKG